MYVKFHQNQRGKGLTQWFSNFV